MKTAVTLRLVIGTLSLAMSIAQAKTLNVCFSPKGSCDQVMASWIDISRVHLDAAIYGLTDPTIAEALVRAHRRGVQVRVVHDKTQAAGQKDVTEILTEAGIPVHIQRGSRGGILHDKFLVIDSSYVITGSFNWTNNATDKNDENFVILDDVAPKFQNEFERLWGLNTDAPPQKTRPTHPR